jgi:hypothetical protein
MIIIFNLSFCFSQETKKVIVKKCIDHSEILYDTITLNKNKIYLYKSTEAIYNTESDLSVQLDSVYIKQDNDCYYIQLDDNNNLILKDTLSEKSDADYTDYELKGYYKELGLYVFMIKHLETSEYIIVNKSNGQIYKTWGIPKFSNDKIHFFSFADALGYDVMPNGLQYCELNKNKFTVIWEYNIEKFIPQEIKVLSKNRLLIKGLIPSYLSKSSKEEYIYIKMDYK